MINLRSFLKSILVTSVAPQILVSVATDKARWVRAASEVWVPNPEYATAPYEISLYNNMDFYLAKMQIDRSKEWIKWQDFAMRLNERHEIIPPTILTYRR
jgi:hypothetical protein